MTEAWGADAVDIGIGGSIPFIADLVSVFPAAQILVTGVEDPDSRAHSPNESLHLGVFQRAILSEALLLARLNQRAGDVRRALRREHPASPLPQVQFLTPRADRNMIDTTS